MASLRERVLVAVEGFVLGLICSMTEGRVTDLQLVFRSRIYDACSRGHDGSFIWGGRLVSRRWDRHGLKFFRTITVLDTLYGNLSEGRSVTQREVFYVLRNYFSTQAQVNEIIKDIASGLGCERSDLLVTTASTGAIAGSIHIQIPNSTGEFDGWIDCEKLEGGWPIPGDIDLIMQVKFKNTRPRAIIGTLQSCIPLGKSSTIVQNLIIEFSYHLHQSMTCTQVIEKFGIFHRLVEDSFTSRVPSILICGGGYPSLSTRAMTNRIAMHFRVPVVGLADFNPHGYEILEVYRRGSANSVHASGCCSGIDLCWLGLRRSHIDALALDPALAIPLSPRDRKMLDRLLREQFEFAPEHIPELTRMREGKFEIQALFSMGYLFLSHSYLPTCLLRGDYLNRAST
ncbi:hypothetical protein NDN08_001618 [Rhodosorus marinus]|uniref:DNA topoisomerase (ATP-hydrolyzing) n=1 Tax=Rhodosorus marinus TaxID=101924 RepID=A0AAV8UVG4_9RHOD|nr:hypothetical protein NDN08_001618 [Rhodosorus marinus]